MVFSTEQYDFIIIELFPIPKIYLDENNIPKNFKTREDANAVVHEYSTALIIDVKKLQSEKEIDDISANISW